MQKKWLYPAAVIIIFLLIITFCRILNKSTEPLALKELPGSNNAQSSSVSSNTNESFISNKLTGSDSSSVSEDSNTPAIPSLKIETGKSSIDTYGYGITSDKNGNSYVTGNTYGSLDGVIKTGAYDMFIIKYDPAGNKLWTRLLGSPNAYTYGAGISSDIYGNSYVSGYTTGNLNGQTLTGKNDLFIIKYNSNGNVLWTRLSGAPSAYTYAAGISTDRFGSSYLTGYTTGNLDGQTLTGKNDLFIIKFDSSGNKLWTRLIGVSEAYTWGTGIATDTNGNCCLTGYTTGNLDGQSITGSMDALVIKYDTSGNKLWSKLSGVINKSTSGRGISMDSRGNSYITGNTTGNLDGQFIKGSMDAFIIKYDPAGKKLWTKLLGAPNMETFGYGIFVDPAGNSFAAGRTNGNLDGQIPTGTQDIFMTKYNSSGIKQWTRLLGIKGLSSWGTGISINSKGYGCISGYLTGGSSGQAKTDTKYLFIISRLNQ